MDVQFKQRTSFALCPSFCPIQELNGLNDACWHRWGWSYLLSLIQMLISFRETLTDTSRNALPVVWAPLTQPSCYVRLIIICCCLIAKSCPTFHNPMDCSTPGFPVPHHLPEFAQVHIHCISYAIQPSHPVTLFSFHLQSFPASGPFPMSKLFTLRDQSIRTDVSASASVLPKSIQGWFPLRLTGLISKGLLGVFSSTTV